MASTDFNVYLPLETGRFTVDCVAGTNRVTSATALTAGTFPVNFANKLVCSIIGHGTYDNTNDNVTCDSTTIFIHAEKAQRITVRWIKVPN